MPAVSKKQANAAGMAFGAEQAGKTLPPSTPAGQMQKGMNVSQLREFASTKRKGLPNKKKKGTPKKAATKPAAPTKAPFSGGGFPGGSF